MRWSVFNSTRVGSPTPIARFCTPSMQATWQLAQRISCSTIGPRARFWPDCSGAARPNALCFSRLSRQGHCDVSNYHGQFGLSGGIGPFGWHGLCYRPDRSLHSSQKGEPMTLPNWSQVSGIADRVVTAGVMYAVGKGWVTSGDATNIVALVLGVASAVYAFVVNRNANLLKQAAAVTVDGQKTTVVAPDELAKALPQSNIVSATDNKVVSK